MIFLIEYNRSLGKIVTFETFADAERRKAEDKRLGLEIELFRQGKELENEVVILEAASEAIIRRTHRRYFEDLEQLMADFQNYQRFDSTGTRL
jgi:hypothetical protein